MDLPQWYIDAQREARSMTFGRVPLELVVAQGEVSKVIANRNISTKFKTNDDALIFMLDHVRTALKAESELAPDDPKNGGTMTFSLTHKNGRISLINTFDTVEYNYPT
jgi:hypothetical protein